MNVVAVIVVLAVIGVVAAVVTGAIGADMDEPTSSLPQAGVPEGELVPDDLQSVRFSLGFRGYRMDEVDQVLDRAAVALVRRDAEIERLRSLLGHAGVGRSAQAHDLAIAWTESREVPEHRGRHLRPEDDEYPPHVRGGDGRVEEGGTDQFRAGEPGAEAGAARDHDSGERPDGERTEGQRIDDERTGEERTDQHRTDEYRTDGQRKDVQRADEQHTDEQHTDEHRTDQHRPDQHDSNGAAPTSAAPAGGRREWSGSDGT